MLKISKQSDYGLIFLSYLKGKKNFVSITEIIEETHLPARFLARIASQLKKNGLVESLEGKHGGYRLGKKIKKTTLYDYLQIFEKNLLLTSCSKKNYQCPYKIFCHHQDFFKNKIKQLIIKNIKNHQLTKII